MEREPARSPLAYVVPQRGRQAVVAAGGGHGIAHKALGTVLAEVTACSAAPEGTGFTEKLNRAAYTAGGLVAAGYLTAPEAQHLLTEAALYARPHQERRIESTIRGGLAAGSLNPLHLGGGRR
jgi:hypothetical protein